MKFRKTYGSRIWTLKLFGGRNTYPVTIEFNFWHFGQKVYHGPFYHRPKHLSILQVKNAEEHWGGNIFPLVWGTGRVLHCVTLNDIDVWRLWIYSRWGTICHIDLTINRRGKHV
jgi:hypothetical protein